VNQAGRQPHNHTSSWVFSYQLFITDGLRQRLHPPDKFRQPQLYTGIANAGLHDPEPTIDRRCLGRGGDLGQSLFDFPVRWSTALARTSHRPSGSRFTPLYAKLSLLFAGACS
jgi:hypothetical protein